jgi:hypothetical protein
VGSLGVSTFSSYSSAIGNLQLSSPLFKYKNICPFEVVFELSLLKNKF